jgi:glycosyltransferase involved in cell wall biosynthesis
MAIPWCTVIVPLCNKGPYVRRALDSVLAQTWADFELLVIYEPSRDDSLAQARTVVDARMQIVEREVNEAAGDGARNLGISLARGRWICFLDADDAWFPGHLEALHDLSLRFPASRFLTTARLLEVQGIRKPDPFSARRGREPLHMPYLAFVEAFRRHERPVNTNSVAVEREAARAHLHFPVGRTIQSGDTYAWQRLAARTGGLSWSPYVGSITYRDVSEASQTGTSSLTLSREMVDELRPYLSRKELRALKRYANVRMFTGWAQHRRLGLPVKPLPLWFFWSAEPLHCLYRCVKGYLRH